jgi:hypothetical protein
MYPKRPTCDLRQQANEIDFIRTDVIAARRVGPSRVLDRSGGVWFGPREGPVLPGD